MRPSLVPRIAWFTPLPPVTSGVSQYNVELLPKLAAIFAIDVFVAEPRQLAPAGLGVDVFSAHDFVWKHARQPYDLVVYQLGNAPCHDYMWAYLVRYPGLVVLHDGQLHHARARSLLEQQRADDYRTEFHFNHPDRNADLAELGIAGLLGSLTYLWPMRRVVIESARMVVVHNQWLAEQIAEEQPSALVHTVEMGVPAPPVTAEARAEIRTRHGIQADALLFVAFGEVTPEKRIPQALRALASIRGTVPHAHLLLAGNPVGHYDARAEAGALGLAEHVTIAGFVPEGDAPAYLASADVCVCLRWPTSRETSAAWLRCLAAGKATITTDLAHLVDIPTLDPRSWTVLHAASATDEPTETTPVEAAAVSIDILDEDHSLRLAMRRLATDARLRAALGEEAKRLWAARFSLEQMAGRYADVLHAACDVPLPDAPPKDLPPPHFVTDGTEFATRQLRQMGLPESRIADIWRSVGGC